LWRKQLWVVICPSQVILLGWSAGFRRKVILQHILPCVPLSDVPLWQPALSAFEHWLGTHEIGRAGVHIVLSNHFVRYALLPFSADVTSHEEEQTLVQFLFEGIYGDISKQWHISLGDGAYGEARLAAAVDAQLLNKLQSAVQSSLFRLNGIKPYLVVAFDYFHSQIKESNGLFVMVEGGQMDVLAFNNGQLSGVNRMIMNGELEQQLPNLLQREILISGRGEDALPIYLHIPGQPSFSLRPIEGMSFRFLHYADKADFSPIHDALFDILATGIGR
jgi:hypothetical protein